MTRMYSPDHKLAQQMIRDAFLDQSEDGLSLLQGSLAALKGGKGEALAYRWANDFAMLEMGAGRMELAAFQPEVLHTNLVVDLENFLKLSKEEQETVVGRLLMSRGT